MDEIRKIRKAYFSGGENIYAIAKQYNRSWETIKRIVDCPRDQLNIRGKRPNREKQVLTDEVKQAIEKILEQEEQLGVHKKQRHTTARIYQELKAQEIYKGSSRSLYELVGRRNYLTGLPKALDWEILNHDLSRKCSQDCTSEEEVLKKLPMFLDQIPPSYSWHRTLDCKIDSYQLATVQEHRYSVPECYVGAQVRALLSIFKVEIYYQEVCISKHSREYVPDKDSLILDHYLDQLRRKPNALWDCKATQQHRFEPFIQNLWSRLESRYPLREANKHFIQVLLLGRKYRKEELCTAIELASSYGSIEAGAIENVLRQLNTRTVLSNETSLKNILSDKAFLESDFQFDLSAYGELCEAVSYANI